MVGYIIKRKARSVDRANLALSCPFREPRVLTAWRFLAVLVLSRNPESNPEDFSEFYLKYQIGQYFGHDLGHKKPCLPEIFLYYQ
jgi:hypothetical protein